MCSWIVLFFFLFFFLWLSPINMDSKPFFSPFGRRYAGPRPTSHRFESASNTELPVDPEESLWCCNQAGKGAVPLDCVFASAASYCCPYLGLWICSNLLTCGECLNMNDTSAYWEELLLLFKAIGILSGGWRIRWKIPQISTNRETKDIWDKRVL